MKKNQRKKNRNRLTKNTAVSSKSQLLTMVWGGYYTACLFNLQKLEQPLVKAIRTRSPTE